MKYRVYHRVLVESIKDVEAETYAEAEEIARLSFIDYSPNTALPSVVYVPLSTPPDIFNVALYIPPR